MLVFFIPEVLMERYWLMIYPRLIFRKIICSRNRVTIDVIRKGEWLKVDKSCRSPRSLRFPAREVRKCARQWPVLDFVNVNNSQAIRYLIEQIIANGEESSETNFQTSTHIQLRHLMAKSEDELPTYCNWTLIEKGISVLNQSMTSRHIFSWNLRSFQNWL